MAQFSTVTDSVTPSRCLRGPEVGDGSCNRVEYQELAGYFNANAWKFGQYWRTRIKDFLQERISGSDFGSQGLIPQSQRPLCQRLDESRFCEVPGGP
jgi:hypothetical protein